MTLETSCRSIKPVGRPPTPLLLAHWLAAQTHNPKLQLLPTNTSSLCCVLHKPLLHLRRDCGPASAHACRCCWSSSRARRTPLLVLAAAASWWEVRKQRQGSLHPFSAVLAVVATPVAPVVGLVPAKEAQLTQLLEAPGTTAAAAAIAVTVSSWRLEQTLDKSARHANKGGACLASEEACVQGVLLTGPQ